MTTKTILVLTHFMLILLIPAFSAGNQIKRDTTASTPPPINVTTYTDAADDNQTQPATATEGKNDTTSATPSSLPSSITTSGIQTTNQPARLSSTVPNKSTAAPAPKSSNSKLIIIVVLLAIMVLMLCAGCLHAMRDRESGEDSSVTGFLQDVRKGMRATVGNLEDRLGLRLWPGGKRGGEDDEEERVEGRQEEEGGQRLDAGGKGGGRGEKKEEKGEHKEEDSDDSDDYSSMEGDNLRERALGRREEEERKQSGNEDGEETSSGSEGGQGAEEGERSGDKEGGSEEIALVNSQQEEDKKADLCDVTVL